MSNWSIAESSDSRLVAQAIPPRSPWSSKAIRWIAGCVAYCPGFVALLVGFSVLPGTINCQVSPSTPNSMECRKVREFLHLPISTETIQLTGQPLQSFSQSLPGDSGFFGFGLLWLGSLTAGLAITQAVAPKKTNWTFDRSTKTVQQQPVTLLQKTTKTFPRSDIQSLVLEIPDIVTNSYQANIFARLNMNAGEIPTQYLLWNENQPAVYTASYAEFSEVINTVIQPICQILELPWQLKFFHQDECFIFDFGEQVIDRYLNGEQLLRIEFAEVMSLEIEEIAPDSSNMLLNIPQESVHYLNLVINQGEKLRIHQFTNADSQEKTPAIEWMQQLQGQLTALLKTQAVV